MNTPDTEWETEFEEKFLNDALDAFPEHPQTMALFLINIKTFIATLLTSRDTYWKERVKTLKKADQIIIHKTLGGGYVCFNPSLVYPANTKIQPVFGKTPEDALSHHLQALDNLK